jgi:N utilization substance protein B
MFRVKFSREVVLKLLYQIDVLGLDDTDCTDILQANQNFFRGLNPEEKDFIHKVANLVLIDRARIDELISQNLIGWSLKRLNTIDRNLIRMGIAESNFNSEKAIVIDDIIRIAKKYGSEDSYRIINAILDKVIQ